MDALLGKIQQLNYIFSKSATTLTPLSALCDQLCNIIGCNIYVFSREGRIFAYSIADAFECPYTKCSLKEEQLPPYYYEIFLSADKAVIDQYEQLPVCTYRDVKICEFDDRYFSLYPIYSNFQKTAGMLLIRYGNHFSQMDNILCEYTSAIISLEMLRQAQTRIQQQSLEIAAAKLAVNSLTFSELRSVSAVLDAMGGTEGDIFLNAVAQKSYSTHSTVSGALKKLEAAGVISTKSKGVKGKYIKITNPRLHEEIYMAEKQYRKEKQKARRSQKAT